MQENELLRFINIIFVVAIFTLIMFYLTAKLAKMEFRSYIGEFYSWLFAFGAYIFVYIFALFHLLKNYVQIYYLRLRIKQFLFNRSRNRNIFQYVQYHAHNVLLSGLLIIIGGIIRFIAIVCQRYNSLLIGQKAKQKGIVVTDQEIDGRINVIAQRQKMSLQDYRDMLKAKGEDFSQFRDKVRQNLQG